MSHQLQILTPDWAPLRGSTWKASAIREHMLVLSHSITIQQWAKGHGLSALRVGRSADREALNGWIAAHPSAIILDMRHWRTPEQWDDTLSVSEAQKGSFEFFKGLAQIASPVSYGIVRHPSDPLAGLCEGLACSLRHENPHLSPFSLETAAISLPLIESLCQPPPERTYLRYQPTGLQTRVWRPCPLRPSSQLRKGGTYLITGQGALACLLARYLRDRYQAVVLMCGRRELRENEASTLKKLGVAAYSVVDLGDASAMRRAWDTWVQEFGAIQGLFHLAGVLEDALWINKSFESFSRVLYPKVQCLQTLDGVIGTAPIELFLCFSSLSGVIGNVGQSDYAAANAYMRRFCEARRHWVAQGRRSGTTLAIDWGLWRAGGMVPERENASLSPLDTQEAFAAMEALLASEQGTGAIFRGSETLLSPIERLGTGAAPQLTSFEAVEAWVMKTVVRFTQLPHLSAEDSLLSQGADSVASIDIALALEADLKGWVPAARLPKTLLFDYPSVAAMTCFLCQTLGIAYQSMNSSLPAPEAARPLATDGMRESDIAIVGLAGRFPGADGGADGGTSSIEAFWNNLKTGKDSVGDIPYERWRLSRQQEGTAIRLQGGFLDNIFDFDPLFFKIAPSEAERMDPQERLLLQEVLHAFEDAAIPLATASQTGVFVAAMFGHYLSHTGEGEVLDFSLASLANRLSFCLNFRGPSLGLDTMCSGSLSAIHVACQSLRQQECDLAVVAGVNLMPHPAKYRLLAQGKFLSRSGRCRSFGQQADGYVPGEGVGVLILKRAKSAREDLDRLYGLIKGSAIGSGGRTAGYTVPSSAAQRDVIRQALHRAAIAAQSISYLEAHGTGTVLGDPIEIEALNQIFTGVDRCALGSVKSNVGHLESAAGMAGVIKVLLQFKHQIRVPTLHADPANPLLDLAESPFYFPQIAENWESGRGAPRRAGVSAFGAGGANAHVILEEPPPPQSSERPHYPRYLLPLSAGSADALQQGIRDLQTWIQSQTDLDSYSLCYGYSCGRDHYRYRKAAIFSSIPDLSAQLGQIGEISDSWENRRPVVLPERLADHHGFPEIAAAYEQGGDIAWNVLYPIRVVSSLPPYPFERLRCLAPAFEEALLSYRGAAVQKTVSNCHLFAQQWFPIRQLTVNPLEQSQQNYRTIDDLADIEGGVSPFNVEQPLIVDLHPLEAEPEQTLCRKLFELGKMMISRGRLLKVIILLPIQKRSMVLRGVPGFFKSLVLEHPTLWVKLIHTDRSVIGSELLTLGKRFEEARYQGGAHWVQQLSPCQFTRGGDNLLRRHGVYLITGGLGKLGQQIARMLLERYQARLYLLGSSSLTPIKSQQLQALREGGGQVTYYPGDITSEAAITEVLSQILEAEQGVLHGVVHAAGRIKDSLFKAKQFEDFWPIVQIKTRGAVLLDEATQNLPLDFFLLFSSVAGVYGNVGQTDYALGNSALDAFAEERNRQVARGERSGRTLSISWPLWQAGGMTLAPEQIQFMQQQGFEVLSTDEGINLFQQLLERVGAESMLMPIKGDLAKIERFSQDIFQAEEFGKPPNQPENPLLVPLRELVAEVIHLPAERLEPEISLADYGFDSVSLGSLSERLAERFAVSLPPNAFFTLNTLSKLGGHLAAQTGLAPLATGSPQQPVLPPYEKLSSKQELAPPRYGVIGMEGLMPGSASLADFWKNLLSGHNLVVPMERWQDPSSYGAVIPNIDHFDPGFFGLSAREAMLMDPQHRLFLQVAYNTFLDAGYDPQTLKRVGVFAGIQFNDYQVLLQQWRQSRHPYAATGNAHAMLANRVSYLFDFNGPSQTMDTACSSALVALRQAIYSLEKRECDYALVGAVSLMIDPVVSEAAKSMGVLSPHFRCATFDAAADGYVRGEGVGCLLLRRYPDARREGDPCHGLIIGSAENHGGRAHSLTAPNPEAQKQLLLTAYANRDVAAQLTVFEAHGTGTKLGDPVEVEALQQAWQEMGLRHSTLPIALASVKTQVGHLEPAAGIASLLKMLLSLRHKTLIGNRHFHTLNPYIQLAGSPFRIAAENRPWESYGPRIAGISAFGFGGANAHVILQEPPPPEETIAPSLPAVLIALSAKHPDSLSQMRRDLLTFLTELAEGDPHYSLSQIAYTLQKGRGHFNYRWAEIVESQDQLVKALQMPYQPAECASNAAAAVTLKPPDPSSVSRYRAELDNWLTAYRGGSLPPWEQLYPHPLSRVSLPTYRFQTAAYWFEQAADSEYFREIVGD